MILRTSTLLAFLVLFLGCAPSQQRRTGQPLKRAPSAFPAAAALDEIEARPVPTPERAEPIYDTETWKLTGPLPVASEAAPRKGTGPWDKAFAAALEGKATLRPTEAMHCVAREIGRYQLEKSGRPPEDLQRFILARCGAISPTVQGMSSVNEMPVKVSEKEAVDSAGTLLTNVANDLSAAGEPLDVGLWFGRVGTKAIVSVAAAPRDIEMPPLAMSVSDGRVTLQGTLRSSAAHVVARVNRGRFESATCEADESVVLPSFSFTCAADPADAHARIELFSYPPDRVLGHSLAAFLVSPGGKPLTDTFQRTAPKVPADAGPGIAAGFLATLNVVRREAGLLEVRATDAQTETAGRVAPHYFSSSTTREKRDKTADIVALGMLAGWKVDGIVHDGMLTSAWSSDAADPSRLLSAMLESPSGRSVLLDRDADVIAIGTMQDPERHFLGALVTVYRLFEYVSPDARVRTVFERIDKLRAARGQPVAAFMKGLGKESEVAARSIEIAHVDPAIALDSFLEASVPKAKRAMRGYVVETSSLDSFDLPDDFTEAASFPVAIAVAYHRPPGEPWGRWVILMVTFANEKA